jgi:hypothetical protein
MESGQSRLAGLTSSRASKASDGTPAHSRSRGYRSRQSLLGTARNEHHLVQDSDVLDAPGHEVGGHTGELE